MRKFPGEFDLDSIYEILVDFKRPFAMLAEQNESEDTQVTMPWSFERARVSNEQQTNNNNDFEMSADAGMDGEDF